MPDEIASQQTPAVTDGSAPLQDPNPAVKPDAESAPAQSGDSGSDPVVHESEKMKRELIENRRRKQLLEQENAYLRGRVDAATTATPQNQQAVADTVVIPARPHPENFESPEAFDAALDAYNDARAEARYAEKRAKERAEEEQRTNQTKAQQIHAAYEERMLKQRDLYPEVDSAIDRIGRFLDPQMQLIIKKSDIPAALLTHFDANPQELKRLNALDPVDKALEMGQLVASIKAKDKPQGQVRQVSQAPDALKVPQDKGPLAITDEDKMSDQDWFATQERKRRENFEQMARSR